MTAPGGDISDILQILRDDLSLHAVALEPLKSGTWSTAYGFHSSGQALVIRLSTHPDDFARDEFAARRFGGPNLPIPSVTHRGEFRDRHYAISERVTGEFLDDQDKDGMHRVLPSLLTHA